jgi:hypothetical protein
VLGFSPNAWWLVGLLAHHQSPTGNKNKCRFAPSLRKREALAAAFYCLPEAHSFQVVWRCFGSQGSFGSAAFYCYQKHIAFKRSLAAVVMLSPSDQDVTSSSCGNNLLQNLQGKAVYREPKWVRLFTRPVQSGSFMDRSALFHSSLSP